MFLAVHHLTRVGKWDYEPFKRRCSIPVWCHLPTDEKDWRALVTRDLLAKGYNVIKAKVMLLLNQEETVGLYWITGFD